MVLDRESKMPLIGATVYLTNREETKDTVAVCYHVDNRSNVPDQFRFKIIMETKTDTSGKFVFDIITKGSYNIVASYKIKTPTLIHNFIEYINKTGIDKNLNIDSIKPYYSKIYLDVVCKYDKTKNQKFCPICKKADKVLPILFGLPIPLFNEQGVEIADKDGRFLKDYYKAGCVSDILCNPTRHCNRCNKDF